MLGVTLARSEVSSLVSVEWVEEEEEVEGRLVFLQVERR